MNIENETKSINEITKKLSDFSSNIFNSLFKGFLISEKDFQPLCPKCYITNSVCSAANNLDTAR